MTRVLLFGSLLCLEAGISVASLSGQVTMDGLAPFAANVLGLIPAVDRCGAAIFSVLTRGFHDVA